MGTIWENDVINDSYNPTIITRLSQMNILIYLLTLDYFVIIEFITHHLHVLLKFMCKKYVQGKKYPSFRTKHQS